MQHEQLPETEAADFSRELRDRTTASMFGVIGSVVFAVLYWLSRSGFENPLLPIAMTVGIALFIVCVPTVVWWTTAARAGAGSRAWWRSQPFLAMVALLVAALAGLSVRVAGAAPAWIILVTGASAALWTTFRWLRFGRLLRAVTFVAFAALFFTWASGVAWSSRHKHPLLMEALAHRANVHEDPLFNVSFGNMMKTYGVPSTGIDGFPYIPYHYGAAWVHAQWSELAAIDLLTFYNMGPSLVMIPVFGFALLMLVVELREALRRRGRPPPRPLDSDWIAGAALAVGTVGVIPTSGLIAMGVWNTHLLISESYITGLPLFLFGVALLLVFHDSRPLERPDRSSLLFLFLLLPLLLIALAFLKVSLMLLTLAGVLWVALRRGLWRKWHVLAAGILWTIVALIVYRVVRLPSQNEGIVPLAYLRYSIPPAWWSWFPVVHLFWSWVYTIARVREEGVGTVRELAARVRDRRLFDVELVLLVAILGIIPGEIVQIHGGSAFYFSDVQRWIALPLVLATAARWLTRETAAVPDTADSRPPGSRRSLAGVRLGHVGLALLALPLVVTALRNLTRGPEAALRLNLTLRSEIYSQAGVVAPMSWNHLRDQAILARGLERSPRFALVSALRRLTLMPREEKRRTGVFIPQSDTAFYRFFPEPDRCNVSPLAGPAISGLALSDGMPPVDCRVTDQSSFGLYPPRTAPQLEADLTDERLCERAAANGFSQLVVLGPPPEYPARTIPCRRP